MTTCSEQADEDGAAAREGCRTLPVAVTPEWLAEQRRKNEAYEAHRRRYALANYQSQLLINPLLKNWMVR